MQQGQPLQGPPDHDFQNDPPQPFPHWSKVALATIQLLLLVFSIALVSTMQFLLIQKKGALELHRQEQRRLETKRTVVTNSKNFIATIAPSEETQDTQLWKHARRNTPANAYWNQVVPYLQEWNALLEQDIMDDSTTSGVMDVSSLPAPSSHTYTALLQAARLGHAHAQYHVANALASGILPFDYIPDNTNMTVPVDMLSHTNDENTMQAFLYWQMAAIDGHVPSQVSLAYRLSEEQGSLCETTLPYYEEASHNIIDMLEQSPNSRAMVQPPMDSHELVEIFSKGAASQLSWSNQPDEPADALRYYHMRAQDADVGAAHTLAQLHHYGLRGVEQNLTLALQYYEMAASHHHVESAGQAGKFYFWGMGIPKWEERNFVKAQSLFQIGAPYGLDGCRQRFRNAQLQKQRKLQTESGDDQCDPPSVNGLGLLQLFGMPLLLKRDVDKAQQYFELARDMGNADASYNLAMMRLGWKTHFHTLDSLEEGGSSTDDGTAVPGFLKEFRAHQHHPSKADYLVALQDLVTAANKGHLQAKHRLATIYSHGVQARDGSTIIAKDCNKALKHFTWIANNANPYLSHHTRRAYKQYIAGDWQGALRNYLAAAEMGHEISQVNAAFLLEQGVCLSLSPLNCAAASLRLWKAAVQTNSEAALRVGDMYYYGRLRDEPTMGAPGPFGWLPYLLYPERVVVPMVKPIVQQLSGGKAVVAEEEEQAEVAVTEEEEMVVEETCEETGEDGTCLATATPSGDNKEEEEIVESDLEMAARYYRLAADVHKSARANFNLGFLYEWGLGVKQDFPLAKRHYDLAKVAPSGEADLPVKIALFAMNLHERLVKFLVAYEEWSETNDDGAETLPGEQVPKTQDAGSNAGHPVPPGPQMGDGGPTTKTDVIIKHLMSWESLAIVILTVVLWKMLQDARRTQQQNRR